MAIQGFSQARGTERVFGFLRKAQCVNSRVFVSGAHSSIVCGARLRVSGPLRKSSLSGNDELQSLIGMFDGLGIPECVVSCHFGFVSQ
jgi:hypothetical protein